MVFERSGEVQPGIEEACNSYIVLCEIWITVDKPRTAEVY